MVSSSFKDDWASVPELGRSGGPQQKLVSTTRPPPDTRVPLPIRETVPQRPHGVVPLSPQRSPSPHTAIQPSRTPGGPPPSRQALGFTPSARQSLDGSFNRFHTVSPAPRPSWHPTYARAPGEQQRKADTFFQDQEERLQRELQRGEQQQSATPPASQPRPPSLAQQRQETSTGGLSELERKQRQLKRVQEFLHEDNDSRGGETAPKRTAMPTSVQANTGAPPRPQADPRDEAMHRSLREGSNSMLYATSIYPSDRNLGKGNEWEMRRDAKERLEAATEHNKAERRLKELQDVKMRNIDERIRALRVELDDSHRELEAQEQIAEKCLAQEAAMNHDSDQTRAHLAAWEQQCLSSWRQTETNFVSFSKVASGHLTNTKRTMVHYLGHVDDSNRTMSEALQGLLLIDAELEDSTVSW